MNNTTQDSQLEISSSITQIITAAKKIAKPKKAADDEEVDATKVEPKPKKATGKGSEDEEETDEEEKEDDWNKDDDENWDPDFDEFDIPSKGSTKKAGKSSDDEVYKLEDDFSEFDNFGGSGGRGSGFDDDDDY